MKHHKNQGQIALNFKETQKCLDAIESLIKAKSYRELGMQKLNEMDTKSLSKEHLVTYHYLNGRYFLYKFQDENDLELLEWANDFFDSMFAIAFKLGIKIKDARLYFSRAYSKFRLYELIWDEERKPWLLKKATEITEKSLQFDPENESFQWLQKQLSA
jgi:hypothetical protein